MLNIRRAILLAAGRGTRLGPLSDVLPKCLMPVNGRPLLEWWLRTLAAAGIDQFLVNLHQHAGLVRRWIGSSPFSRRVTLSEEPRLLGTGGTLLANADFCDGRPILLIHADNLCACPWQSFFSAHAGRPAGTLMTLMTFDSDHPESCGIVETDADGVVRAFHEKVAHPPGRRANAAVYIVEPQVVDFLAALGKPVIDFSTEVLPHFVDRMATWHNAEYLRDIGTPRSLLAAQQEWPFSGTAPDGTDGWAQLCAAADHRLAREFSVALAAALDTAHVFLPRVPAGFCARQSARHYPAAPLALCAAADGAAGGDRP